MAELRPIASQIHKNVYAVHKVKETVYREMAELCPITSQIHKNVYTVHKVKESAEGLTTV
jgi:hypothetical protein